MNYRTCQPSTPPFPADVELGGRPHSEIPNFECRDLLHAPQVPALKCRRRQPPVGTRPPFPAFDSLRNGIDRVRPQLSDTCLPTTAESWVEKCGPFFWRRRPGEELRVQVQYGQCHSSLLFLGRFRVVFVTQKILPSLLLELPRENSTYCSSRIVLIILVLFNCTSKRIQKDYVDFFQTHQLYLLLPVYSRVDRVERLPSPHAARMKSSSSAAPSLSTMLHCLSLSFL